MGWFGGLFGGDSEDKDPLAKLDPKLREFLARESPVKYQSAEEVQRQQAEQQQKAQAVFDEQNAAAADAEKPVVPRESLFQDGRYAHLWKTYRPLAVIEAETKSDSERLSDVLDAFKERRAKIGRAAMENCVMEQLEYKDCMKNGPLSSRMRLCHDEMKKFERCYNIQSRMLKGLGYLSTFDRDPNVDERIQQHADVLYQRVMQQEAEIARAKAEGRPVPKIDLSGAATSKSPGDDMSAAAPGPATTPALRLPEVEVPEYLRQQWDERLAKMPEAERPGEEAALRAELAAHNEMGSRVKALLKEQAEMREQRMAEGKGTPKDRFMGLFGSHDKAGSAPAEPAKPDTPSSESK